MQAMIHRTTEERVDAILREGLRTDMSINMTDGGIWAHTWYEKNPVYLAFPDAPFLAALPDEGVDIAVDASGLTLVADLPSLCDIGGHIEDGVIWWKEGREPPALAPFLDEDGGIEIEFLIDPACDVPAAAIRATRTAACLSDVGLERLELRVKPGVPVPAR